MEPKVITIKAADCRISLDVLVMISMLEEKTWTRSKFRGVCKLINEYGYENEETIRVMKDYLESWTINAEKESQRKLATACLEIFRKEVNTWIR